MQVERPLVYFYGAASPQDNPELYRSYVERLAGVLEDQAAASLEVRNPSLCDSVAWIARQTLYFSP